MTTTADTLEWVPPGPGSWTLAADHYPRPITETHKAFLPIWSEATTAFMTQVGFPVEGMRMAEVNGFPYVSMVGEGSAKPPPAWAMPILARLVPSLRRAERDLGRYLSERPWVAGVDEWYEVLRPAAVARLRALAEVDPDELAPADLADHLLAAYDEWQRDGRLHISLGCHDVLPAAVFVADLVDHGVDVAEAFGLLTGGSPVSRGDSDELAALRRTLAGRPLTALTGHGLGADVDAALQEYLLVHGWRLIDGYDVDCTCLVEVPDLVHRGVEASSGDGTEDPDERVAAVRALLPAERRAGFTRDLAEARRCYGMRDDNGLVLIAWSTGLLRRSMLAAGRALRSAGALEDPDLAIEATPPELASALRGERPLDHAVLAARRAHRRRWRSVDAPRALGDPEAPPPAGLPGALGRFMRAFTIMEQGAEPTAAPLEGLGLGDRCYEGTARLVLGAGAGLGSFEPGDVLVAPMTSPSYNRLLALAGALVTDTGGVLSHAAVMARELDLPAVLATGDATARLRDGDRVVVDPVRGSVRVVAPAGLDPDGPSTDPADLSGHPDRIDTAADGVGRPDPTRPDPTRDRGGRRARGLVLGVVAALVLALAGSACSDDSGDTEAADETVATTAAPAETTTTTAGPTTVEVTAADYAFAGVPEAVAAGSTISLTTEAGGEPHEVVAVLLPDEETRPAGELAALPDAELGTLFAEEAALVTIALPGTTDTPGPVVGDGTLSEPGRYLLLCTFPQDTTVEDVESSTGPLQGDDPHYTLGMFAELSVE